MIYDLLSLCGTTASTSTTTSSSKASSFGTIGLLVVMVVVMYFLMIRPQKKKQQEEQQLRDSIQIGDEITTIGGIQGRVVTVKDDSIVIETGSDRIKMKLMRWAVQTNDTANARAAEEKKALDEAKAAEKAEKKAGKRRSKKSDADEAEKEDKE